MACDVRQPLPHPRRAALQYQDRPHSRDAGDRAAGSSRGSVFGFGPRPVEKNMNLRSSLPAAAFAAPPAGSLALPAAASPAGRQGVRGNFELTAVQPPALDLDAIAAEDEARESLDVPLRFAIPQPVSLSPDNSGLWERLPDGRAIWRLRVESVNAQLAQLRLRPLPMSPNGSARPSTPPTAAARSAPSPTATTTPTASCGPRCCRSRDVVIELVVPQREVEKVVLELTSINQGYRGFGTASLIKSGSCNLDVACLDVSDPWKDTARASANISTGGSAFCSGSLVNNTANDHKMYFVTAAHCGITSGQAPSLVTYWNYENSFCRTPAPRPAARPATAPSPSSTPARSSALRQLAVRLHPGRARRSGQPRLQPALGRLGPLDRRLHLHRGRAVRLHPPPEQRRKAHHLRHHQHRDDQLQQPHQPGQRHPHLGPLGDRSAGSLHRAGRHRAGLLGLAALHRPAPLHRPAARRPLLLRRHRQQPVGLLRPLQRVLDRRRHQLDPRLELARRGAAPAR